MGSLRHRSPRPRRHTHSPIVKSLLLTSLVASATLALTSACHAAPTTNPPMRFDFGAGAVASGTTQITPASRYSAALGYGLISADELKGSATPGASSASAASADALRSDAIVADHPFSFAIDLPEGNYDVTVLLGDPTAAADTTVKAETRRLMLESVKTKAGSLDSRTFTVNIRQPAIAGGGRVSLKEREKDALHWDNKLILEFNGPHAAVAGLDIRRNDSALTVYLAGDSTVTDQPGEPWASWGQMLPRYFPAGVAIANHAESGLSLASFRGQKRLDKILSTIRPGDYVLIQFAHNDQKEKGEGVGAFTTYAASLRSYVDAIRAKDGIPVLVTSMYRRRFDAEGKVQDSLGDFPTAMRQVAKEKKTPLIDLHAMSAKLFGALGAEPSKAAFVHFKAGSFPGQDKDLKDDTHFSPYGAYELARCIVEGIRSDVPELAKRLSPDAGHFDPSHPDSVKDFNVPTSPPSGSVRIPDGDGR